MSPDEINAAYEELTAGGADEPELIQVELGALRAWPKEIEREDILALLKATADLPAETLIQITRESCGVLVDDEGNLQAFA
jgi:hypothetical protein